MITTLLRFSRTAALVLAAALFPSRGLAQPAPAPPAPAPPAPAPPAPAPPAPPDLPPPAVGQPVPPAPPRSGSAPGSAPPPAPRAPAPGGFPGTPLAPQQGSPGGWGATPLPDDAPAAPPPAAAPPAKQPGVTAKGLPLSQRGGIVAEIAGMLTSTSGSGSGGGTPNAAIDLRVSVPVADRTFIDADLPIGFGALGNPMVGAHHVFRPLDQLWITLGGAFGFPLINNGNFERFAFANALWDAQRFMAYKMPFAVRLGIEGHTGIVEMRAQLEPVWGVSIATCDANTGCNGGDERDVHYFALQHAVEVQVGHEIGGGLRYQGVVIGTNNSSLIGTDSSMFGGSDTRDRYQGTLEPFFRLYRDPIFLRLGLILPLDKPLGAPFDHNWGVRATTGFNLD